LLNRRRERNATRSPRIVIQCRHSASQHSLCSNLVNFQRTPCEYGDQE
jgi:hypothetical protein